MAFQIGQSAFQARRSKLAQHYEEAVVWIAVNDEPEDLDVSSVAGFISVVLVADLWSANPADVAADVVRTREWLRREPEAR